MGEKRRSRKSVQEIQKASKRKKMKSNSQVAMILIEAFSFTLDITSNSSALLWFCFFFLLFVGWLVDYFSISSNFSISRKISVRYLFYKPIGFTKLISHWYGKLSGNYFQWHLNDYNVPTQCTRISYVITLYMQFCIDVL